MKLATAVFISSVFLVLCPFSAQAANIYFDDFHDTNGDDLNGNLSNFRDAVIVAGHTITQLNVPITAGSLAGYDLLILYDTEAAMTGAEITAIQQWLTVGCCRGLWVIGEAPGAFDFASANALLAPYNIQFNGLTGALNPDVATPVGFHPTMAGVTSLSLIFHGLLDVTPPALCIAQDTPGACVGAAVDYFPVGLGRVAVWGDSAAPTNGTFGTNDELVWALNTIDWLTEDAPVSVETSSWGAVKALYR